ncbi:hypothetical protein C2E23DRAFT_354743 [Lenzites betulinus]|nr:hypothetical protein C2E23DRAFT_354743 [Lenzites betulinus]
MQPVAERSEFLRTAQHTSEATPLLIPPRATLEDVRPLRFTELLRGMNCTSRAFDNGNSLMRYIQSANTWPLAGFRVWLTKLLTYGSSICQGRVLTVGAGAAILIYSTPKVNKHHWLIGFLVRVLNIFRPAELSRRREEYAAGVRAQVLDAFGAKVGNMYEIQGLATDPAAQGRGYGGLLVKTVTNMSDAEGRDVWVVTSDARPFYERFGFSVKRTVFVGANNPSWAHEPVNISIMHRPAKLPEGSQSKGELGV